MSRSLSSMTVETRARPSPDAKNMEIMMLLKILLKVLPAFSSIISSLSILTLTVGEKTHMRGSIIGKGNKSTS